MVTIDDAQQTKTLFQTSEAPIFAYPKPLAPKSLDIQAGFPDTTQHIMSGALRGMGKMAAGSAPWTSWLSHEARCWLGNVGLHQL